MSMTTFVLRFSRTRWPPITTWAQSGGGGGRRRSTSSDKGGGVYEDPAGACRAAKAAFPGPEASHPWRSPKLRKAINIVPVTMLQDSPHINHFKHLLDFG